jgi:ribosomal protein S12 methylthiotransferase
MPAGRFWLETLGCPKNEVDSDKLVGQLLADGYVEADDPSEADLVVVNTCAFIEAAREESVETILSLGEVRPEGSRLVVTGCMAERYGDELAAALPEVDLVAGFGASLTAVSPTRVVLGAKPDTRAEQSLLELPRSQPAGPWAYVKVAEGCDRRCGFCAIPTFRGDQRSRSAPSILAEIEALAEGGTKEVVLIAQDLASWGLDRRAVGEGAALDVLDDPSFSMQPLVELVGQATELIERVRLLYLYPSGLTERLIEAVLATDVPYFDLSLQHVSRPLMRAMRRWGDGDRFLERIAKIREADTRATFRSSFILGYPGETEADHDALLEFIEAAELDWGAFFTFSPEEGTHAATLADQVPASLAAERLAEVSDLQDRITQAKRDALVGETRQVLIDAPGQARSVHEAPDIDGIIEVPEDLIVGTFVDVTIIESLGTDLVGVPHEATS